MGRTKEILEPIGFGLSALVAVASLGSTAMLGIERTSEECDQGNFFDKTLCVIANGTGKSVQAVRDTALLSIASQEQKDKTVDNADLALAGVMTVGFGALTYKLRPGKH